MIRKLAAFQMRGSWLRSSGQPQVPVWCFPRWSTLGSRSCRSGGGSVMRCVMFTGLKKNNA